MAAQRRRLRWSDDDVMTFIETYKKLECLWNPRLEEYKDKKKREWAYNEILSALSMSELTVEDIKNKIKGIRTTYCEELRKILNSERTNQGVYQPRVIWFKTADSFLREVTDKFKSIMTVKEAEEHRRRRVEIRMAKAVLKGLSHRTIRTIDNSKTAGETNLGDTTLNVPTTSNHRAEHTTTNRAANNPEDEFDLFARSIALQIRKLPELDALDLMQQIQVMVINKKRQILADQTQSQTIDRLSRKRPRTPSSPSENELSEIEENHDGADHDPLIQEIKLEP